MTRARRAALALAALALTGCGSTAAGHPPADPAAPAPTVAASARLTYSCRIVAFNPSADTGTARVQLTNPGARVVYVSEVVYALLDSAGNVVQTQDDSGFPGVDGGRVTELSLRPAGHGEWYTDNFTASSPVASCAVEQWTGGLQP